MKKLYTTPEYKHWHKRQLKSLRRKKRGPKKEAAKKTNNKASQTTKSWKSENHLRKKAFKRGAILPEFAPSDFRLFENTEECLLFFRNIRNPENVNQGRNVRFVKISLVLVEEIDYGTISALTAIGDDLKFKGVTLQGDFPKNQVCQQFIADSGFLNHMYDEKNRKFPKAPKSDMIFFEKGSGKLSSADNVKISQLVKAVVTHITGQPRHCLPVKTILLEICGNSIEHAYSDNRQWLLGVKYESNKVVFTVTDVGKGILETLHRKFSRILMDEFLNRTNLEILNRAFDQKYGSSTQEANRNKGLPAVKANSDFGTIQDLKVLTNNVLLQFGNNTLSRAFGRRAPRFRGTMYQWELNQRCLDNIL